MILRKLSSYPGRKDTKKALCAPDNIRPALHILDFIDNLPLPESVWKASHRGEANHRVRRAISSVYCGKLRVSIETALRIWSKHSRLIVNAIIYFRTLRLSRVFR